MSTATWVAGTPNASMPDFTEPPEAPAVALYRLAQHCTACRVSQYGLGWFGIYFQCCPVTVYPSFPVHVCGYSAEHFRRDIK